MNDIAVLDYLRRDTLFFKFLTHAFVREDRHLRIIFYDCLHGIDIEMIFVFVRDDQNIDIVQLVLHGRVGAGIDNNPQLLFFHEETRVAELRDVHIYYYSTKRT